MYSNNKETIRKELEDLCLEYINILDKMKNEKIISEEIYENCSSRKILFLEE